MRFVASQRHEVADVGGHDNRLPVLGMRPGVAIGAPRSVGTS